MSFAVHVDWNGDGDFSDTGETVTTRTLSERASIGIGYGRDTARAGSPIVAGEAHFELNSASGDYYPDLSTGPLFGSLLAARATRIQKTLSAVTYPLFQGAIDDYVVNANTDEQSVSLSCFDGLARLKSVDISTDLYQGIRTGTAIGHVLDAAGWSSTLRDLDVGATTIRWWWEEGTNAFEALEKIVNSEGFPALVFVDPATGNIVFKDRHHRLLDSASITSQATFRGATTDPIYSSIRYDHGARNVINDVTLDVAERDPDSELSAVWSSTSSYSIADGQTLQIKATTSDPFYGAVTPVAATDYQLRSGAVTVTLSRTQGAATTIGIKATGGPAVLDSLQLRAYSVPVQRTMQVHAEDPVSIGTAAVPKYGRRSYPITAPWAGVHDAQAIADMVLAYRAERLPIVAITVRNANNTRWTQQLARALSDRVTIINTRTGLSADFFIERIEHTVSSGGLFHETTFTCEKVPTAIEDVFTFDVAGRGFNDGVFGTTGLDNADTIFVFDDASQGFNDGLFAN